MRTTEMKLLRYFTFVAAVGLAVAADAATARAADGPIIPVMGGGAAGPGCTNCGQGGHGGHGFGNGGFAGGNPPPPSTLFNGSRLGQIFHKQKAQLPVFQAAPWYNYWPYDAHFLTPAPVSGPFYGPPMTGNFPVNPYFPGPAGAAGFGPIPGGPPPGYPLSPPMLMAPGGR
jgi:hypothetical protein